MLTHEELFEIAERLKPYGDLLKASEVAEPLDRLEQAAREVGKSFSGSWLGYHSRVYYKDFAAIPPGANFSQEWGLRDTRFPGHNSRGDWHEYDADFVMDTIDDMAGCPNLEDIRKQAAEAEEIFESAKAQLFSILSTEIAERKDEFLNRLLEDLEKRETKTKHDFAEYLSPKGKLMTRDTLALGQGLNVPPHMSVLTDVFALRHPFGLCKIAAEIAAKAASHLERKDRREQAMSRVGTNVFIGHGRSQDWRALKDFIQERLKLPWDEFNRVPVAGVTNIARLSEMLDAAAIAFLVLTAEDEAADGTYHARLNVIHEAGLFQGRLGFTRAIVLLEDDCKEFSNIQGLGQIRFPKGNIAAIFEEVRRVVEREGLISSE